MGTITHDHAGLTALNDAHPPDLPGAPPARAFASAAPLQRGELLAAPLRWPRPSRLREPLRAPGRAAAAGLRSLGLYTVGDLLEHLPSASRRASTVAALGPAEQATVAVEVRSISKRPVRRRGMRPLVEARVGDATGTMRATFFNQPWLVDRYPPGTRLLLHGRADGRGGFRVAHHAPAVPELDDAPDLAGSEELPGDGQGAVAHYPAAEGISSTQILTMVGEVQGELEHVPEPLDAGIRTREGLPDRAAALSVLHLLHAQRAGGPSPGEREVARRRLAFEELLLAQLALLRRRARRRQRGTAAPLRGEPELTARWLARALPFEPTSDQRTAIAEISTDLAAPQPMQRLLMGEVGSGKTVVALHAMLRAVEHGRQAALMAPTETLAEQHFATIQDLLGDETVACALLTGSTPAARRRDILGKLAGGELALVVGTHALIEPDVEFAGLAVTVIDEQHRFGVRQRAALESKGDTHTLHMTATPIPRTLALARYGDLDTSTLRELPRGRQPIETRLVAGARARARAYEQLRAELDAGRRAYVVCPLIETADEDGEPGAGSDPGDPSPPAQARAAEPELRAATAELERLRAGELRGYRLALLHGGMRPREKQAAMAAFASGEAQVLVATTVIEVGIDVADATVMLIENAERFGISQLHQLRGRVGRGEHASRCFLAGPPEAASSARLRALAAHSDGFRLAQIDLELRKEGELLGTRQSGLHLFRHARLPEDETLLEHARAHAEELLLDDPELSGRGTLLADALAEHAGGEELAPIPG
jgi:ATP-dependent DNA helicase RecG